MLTHGVEIYFQVGLKLGREVFKRLIIRERGGIHKGTVMLVVLHDFNCSSFLDLGATVNTLASSWTMISSWKLIFQLNCDTFLVFVHLLVLGEPSPMPPHVAPPSFIYV